MASDSRLMSLVVKDYKPIFEGLGSLVDVGGGTGTVAKIISEAFPHMKCTVFDLPHVVANLKDSQNLKYVGGDMFQSIPSADAILFKACDIIFFFFFLSIYTFSSKLHIWGVFILAIYIGGHMNFSSNKILCCPTLSFILYSTNRYQLYLNFLSL